MSSYTAFAEVYDRLMTDADYKGRTQYLLRLFEKYDRLPTDILDLACGTGGFSLRFAERGIKVTGVDMSCEMLAVARHKADIAGENITYVCQRAEELELPGLVGGAICCLDSLNHITDYGCFCEALRRTARFLEKGRLFIFDVNTVYKALNVLADNTFVIDTDDVYCVWQNFTDKETLTTDVQLDFFTKKDGVYFRSTEDFSERAYTEEQIEKAILDAGLKVLSVFGEMTEKAPDGECERAVYVTQRE